MMRNLQMDVEFVSFSTIPRKLSKGYLEDLKEQSTPKVTEEILSI